MISAKRVNFARLRPQIRTKIDFNDTKQSFESKSLHQLLRGYLVFQTCQIQPLVRNAEPLLKTSYKFLGTGVTNSLLKSTFFGHFCAGEDAKRIAGVVGMLKDNGIGSILDYAAESDVQDEEVKSPEPVTSQPTTSKAGVQCRIYDYKNERECDKNKQIFIDCINAVKSVSPTGFAAIKCTALGNPELLKRASTAIVELRKLFQNFDVSHTGFVTKDQFSVAYKTYFQGGDLDEIFTKLDSSGDGVIDYIEWSNGLPLENLSSLTSHCKNKGPLALATLDSNEVELMLKMRERIHELGTLAQSLGVRLMIDAEHTYFQPAIDNITVDLARKFNRGAYPAIFGTYQMYLKDSKHRLMTDIERAKKGGYKFAAKLVRGAYMVLERDHAQKTGQPDPINPNLEATHANYNGAVQEIIYKIAQGQEIEMMIASHNQQSVELALQAMATHQLTPSSGVYFGQLLGMADHLTYALGKNGYRAYKYVPYGEVHEVMPYLIRRAQENSGAFSGASLELSMISKEVKRRLF